MRETLSLLKLTNYQLDEAVAKAQGWRKQYRKDKHVGWIVPDTKINKHRHGHSSIIPKSMYTPTIDEIQSLYLILDVGIDIMQADGTYYASKSDTFDEAIKDKDHKRAICLAVVADKFGDMIEL